MWKMAGTDSTRVTYTITVIRPRSATNDDV